ncbi:MAG: hypothetical protein HY823_07295 [Acidobacteria bacterium]|nr:hypothetical protein [Acidobacteriota bacterium]
MPAISRVLCALFLAAALSPSRAEDRLLVSLKDFVAAEVRQQGFTLPGPGRIHIYARGGGPGEHDRFSVDGQFHAYGWILNALTREVVWQMALRNSEKQGPYRVSDVWVDLPAGSYEAYFSNHAHGRHTPFSHWNQNIDRRRGEPEDRRRHRWLRIFGLDAGSRLREWREQAANFGMEVHLDGPGARTASTFQAPLDWKNIVLRLAAVEDNGFWRQAFRLTRPTTLHVYAEGESRGRRLRDQGWILDARTRKRVWEMSPDTAQYAGGARKNVRQVETIQLGAGDYEACYSTDDSHSPADWNAAPPCDPLHYGLTLSVPADAERPQVVLVAPPKEGSVLAEIVRVGNHQDRRQPFTLRTPRSVRILCIGEGDDEDLADRGWIEDAKGERIWSMAFPDTLPAGGASKNRLAEAALRLPRGDYVLRYRTDDSHAYGRWNSAPPRNPERYGITVYEAD